MKRTIPGLLAVVVLALASCTSPAGHLLDSRYTYEQALAEYGVPDSETIGPKGARIASWSGADRSDAAFPVQDEASGEIVGSRDLVIETRRSLELTFNPDGHLKSYSWEAHTEIR